jgi:hypothetical protein
MVVAEPLTPNRSQLGALVLSPSRWTQSYKRNLHPRHTHNAPVDATRQEDAESCRGQHVSPRSATLDWAMTEASFIRLPKLM